MTFLTQQQKNGLFIGLACLVSFALGAFSYSQGISEANRHAEELAHIEAGDGRPDVTWTLVGLGLVLILGACAWRIMFGPPRFDDDDEDGDDMPSDHELEQFVNQVRARTKESSRVRPTFKVSAGDGRAGTLWSEPHAHMPARATHPPARAGTVR